jgi:hypothetical protein
MAAVHPRVSHPPASQRDPSPGCVIPGGELLEGLLGVLVVFPRDRLREGALGGPGNRGRAGCRDSRIRTANLRCGAQEGHGGCQLARDKLRASLRVCRT